MVLLKCIDGVTVEVAETVALKSKMLKHALEESIPERFIPLDNITGEVMFKIVDYMAMQTELESKKPQEIVEKSPELEGEVAKAEEALKAWKQTVVTWEEKYMDVSMNMLYDLFLGANFMDIQGLLSLCAEKIANLIKGKTVKEIRKTFNITNDFTPEEEEEYQKKYEWAFSD
ncbi:SKP1-like protein 1B-like protein [Carex littledalei]|uniref:SKP1-like protein n=1 Tax=Carex littledalei TaxID=544730 RepID=A0A833VDY9_9POAL|nr:SKP1-like protein 1B-like protein [Carex littledalei]